MEFEAVMVLTMVDRTISISTDFSKYPGPRYRIHGPNSGEEFRDEILVPALQQALNGNSKVNVVIDDVAGYGSSFLEEAFGGLLRHGFTYDQIISHLAIIAKTNRFQHHRLSALAYITDELNRQKKAGQQAHGLHS